MKIERINESHQHGAKIFRTRNINEEVSKSFHFEFTVDGIKSSQNVNANNMQLAKELVQKQYTGKNIVFQKSEEIRNNQTANESLLNEADDEFDMSLDELSSAPEVGAEAGMSAILNSLIRDEWEAIDGYNSAIIAAKDSGLDDIAQVLTHIQNEENKHVGELQECLKQITNSAEQIGVGEDEASQELRQSETPTPIQDDVPQEGNPISIETSFFEADDDVDFN